MKILKEMGIPDHLICLLRNLYVGQEVTVRIIDGTIDRFKKLGKESVKAVYHHLAYLTYMQCRPCKMPGCIKHKLESKIARRNVNKLKICR